MRDVRRPRGGIKSSAGCSASVLFVFDLWRSTPQADVDFVSELPCLRCRMVSSYLMNMPFIVNGKHLLMGDFTFLQLFSCEQLSE